MNIKKTITVRGYKKIILILFAVLSISFSFSSCDSDKVDTLYTFSDKMIGEYLNDSASVYSEFYHLLDTTKVLSLMNAYGEYTCFAPTNAAMRSFYAQKGRKSLADFPLDTLKIMAYNHIIKGSKVYYTNFRNGRLNEVSMSDRYFFISFDSLGNAIINKSAFVLIKDIELYNGIIHKIDKVINPTNYGLVASIGNNKNFSLFYSALVSTGLVDSLAKIQDNNYSAAKWSGLISMTEATAKSTNSWFYDDVPALRKYGYTVLMESDNTYKSAGINTLNDLKAYAAKVYDEMYPEDAGVTDISDRRNSLNRFVSYHLIDKQLSYSKFIDDYVMYNNSFSTSHMINGTGLNMYEYIETMCPNTLIEVTRKGGTVLTNLLNRDPETESWVNIVKTNSDNDATNGVYHEIDKILAYTKSFDNILSSKRLRFDAASLFPELTNNNMRGSGLTEPNVHHCLPRGYVDRISCSEQTVIKYLGPYSKYLDYQGDEIFLGASTGKLYDFTITTLPVPAGTYEVRFGYLTNGRRGVAQLYLDDVPAGVPLNLNTSATDASIGYEYPYSVASDYYGYENDKMMRNRGYMKAPASFRVPVEGWQTQVGEKNARFCKNAIRKIMGIYQFKKAGHHTLTVKGLSGGEFMFDYLEFVPISAIESEDIY